MNSKFELAGKNFAKFCETVAALRHPTTGCPWDLAQTHSTLRRYMIEEAYEACEVMDPVDSKKLQDELGDVLLQVVLNSQLGADAKEFSIDHVIESIDSKMKRRHPHVFGSPEEQKQKDQDSIRKKWAEVKASENSKIPVKPSNGVFEEVSRDQTLIPNLKRSVAIGKVAKGIKFDWNNPKEVFEQVQSELAEVEQELAKDPNKQTPSLYEEMGDLFFSIAQLCRHLDIDPEVCIYDGNKKFLKRFAAVEELCKKAGIDVKNTDPSTLHQFWVEAKNKEKLRKG